MAVTNIKRQQDTAYGTQQTTSATPYEGLSGVYENTKNNLGNYQQGYKPSDQAVEAGKRLDATMQQKPGVYQSKYTDQLDAILEEISNPQEFKYSFDGDELFKSYADEYTQRGKQASLDTMGQAAALTGGYGNSYAQAAGNQAYQQYLLGLYDKGLDLYDRAYERNKDNQSTKQTQANMLMSLDDRDYTRYQDSVANWQNDRDFAASQASAIAEQDYNQYKDMLTYYTGLAEIENQAWNTEEERAEAIRQYNQDFAENQRQFNETLAENQRQFNESLAWDQEESYRDYNENVRQYNTTLAENQRQYDTTFAENQRQYDTTLAEDQRQYDTSLAWDQEESNRDLARDYVVAILENGGTPSDDLLSAAWLTAADAEALRAEVSGGSGGSGGSKGNSGLPAAPTSPVDLGSYFEELGSGSGGNWWETYGNEVTGESETKEAKTREERTDDEVKKKNNK